MSKELDAKREQLTGLLEAKKQLESILQQNKKGLNEALPYDLAVELYKTGQMPENEFLEYKNGYEALETSIRMTPDTIAVFQENIEKLKAEIKDLEAQSSKKRQFPLAVCVLSCLCVVLAACSLWFWNETQHLNAEVETLSEENSKLEARVSDISQKIAKKDVEYQSLQNEKAELESEKERSDRLESILGSRVEEVVDALDKIGFIVEGSKYYHRFECKDYTGAQEYWAHNVEYCEYLGYSRCPKCW